MENSRESEVYWQEFGFLRQRKGSSTWRPLTLRAPQVLTVFKHSIPVTSFLLSIGPKVIMSISRHGDCVPHFCPCMAFHLLTEPHFVSQAQKWMLVGYYWGAPLCSLWYNGEGETYFMWTEVAWFHFSFPSSLEVHGWLHKWMVTLARPTQPPAPAAFLTLGQLWTAATQFSALCSSNCVWPKECPHSTRESVARRGRF